MKGSEARFTHEGMNEAINVLSSQAITLEMQEMQMALVE